MNAFFSVGNANRMIKRESVCALCSVRRSLSAGQEKPEEQTEAGSLLTDPVIFRFLLRRIHDTEIPFSQA